jgi:hypothetical protein
VFIGRSDEPWAISLRGCIVVPLLGGDFASWCRLHLHPDRFGPGFAAATRCICSFPLLGNG